MRARVLALLSVLGAASAGAQVTLRPVEAGEDRSPLGTSQRLPRADLRSPAGFDRLFIIESVTDPSWASMGIKPGMYARISGGVVAVFDRGQYTPTRVPGVERVDVPTTTRFLMGDTSGMLRTLDDPAQPDTAPARTTLRSDAAPAPLVLRQGLHAEGAGGGRGEIVTSARSPAWEAMAQPDAESTDAPAASPRADTQASVWTSELYRRATLATILQGARPAPGADRPADAPGSSSQPESQPASREPTGEDATHDRSDQPVREP